MVPVQPYGLERLRTAAAGVDAWEVELLDPFLLSDAPLALAESAARRLQPDLVGLGVRVIDDCIVVAQPGNSDETGEPFDLAWFGPEIRELRETLGRAAPAARFVLGGAAFSAFPRECLEYLDVELGIVGAGDEAFPALLDRLAEEAPLDGIPGLIRRGETATSLAYQHAYGGAGPTLRDPLYAPLASLPVRTRIGCAMQCAYCLTANLGRTHSEPPLEPVLDEIEATVAHARAHGVARAPVFFADDELNLPGEGHAIALLNGLVERGLTRKMTWRGYFNPTPFSDELARLVAATNGHASITVDSAAEVVIARAYKPFRRSDLDALIPRLVEHGVSCDVGLIFGLPGETEETIAETIGWVRSLPSSIRIAYSIGARVYPHTPLARIAREEPRHLVGAGGATFLEPVVYSSPYPPRRLADLVARELDGLVNAGPVSVSYRTAARIDAPAYRVILEGRGGPAWAELLDRAEQEGRDGRTASDRLLGCLHLAMWHKRFDLAAAAAGRLLGGVELPEGVTRGQLRRARALCLALVGAARIRHPLRRRPETTA